LTAQLDFIGDGFVSCRIERVSAMATNKASDEPSIEHRLDPD